MPHLIERVSATALLVFCLTTGARAQQGPAVRPPTGTTTAVQTTSKLQNLNETEDFRPLFEERGRLIDELTELDRDIREMNAKVENLPPLETLRTGLAQARRDLEAAQKAQPLNQPYIDSIQQYITATEANIEALSSLPPQIREKNSLYNAKYRRFTEVEQRIASLFEDTKDVRNFRKIVTITFGVLVLFVIAGFYLIAWYKHGVASTIFSGEMGMQFVTLFLIVIAIILFGIMGTLEGRELAALLGGLSGYILGRAADGAKKTGSRDDRTAA